MWTTKRNENCCPSWLTAFDSEKSLSENFPIHAVPWGGRRDFTVHYSNALIDWNLSRRDHTDDVDWMFLTFHISRPLSDSTHDHHQRMLHIIIGFFLNNFMVDKSEIVLSFEVGRKSTLIALIWYTAETLLSQIAQKSTLQFPHSHPFRDQFTNEWNDFLSPSFLIYFSICEERWKIEG